MGLPKKDLSKIRNLSGGVVPVKRVCKEEGARSEGRRGAVKKGGGHGQGNDVDGESTREKRTTLEK